MFKKEKDIELTFVCHDANAYHQHSVHLARNNMPDWYKNLPKPEGYNFDKDHSLPNMKLCSGLTDMYDKMIEIPMWSDVAFKIGKKGTNFWAYAFASMDGGFTQHNEYQRGTFRPDESNCHMKLDMVWMVESSEPVDLLMLMPSWSNNYSEHITWLEGVLDTEFISTLNVNMMFARKDEDYELTLKENDPAAFLLPLTQKNVKIKTELVSKDEWEVRRAATFRPTSFVGGLQKARKSKAKCPFRFNR